MKGHSGSRDHLVRINAEMWPSIATVPEGFRVKMKARKAESGFAAACSKAGLRLDGEDPDLVVVEETLFRRIAEAGWLGLAEGYMAEEWTSERLVDVLVKLFAVGYNPKASHASLSGEYQGKEIPPQLIRLFSGDGMSVHGTVFSSGVPTTERTSVRSFVRGAGKTNEPASHFVDVTTVSDPTVVEKADLGDGQLRATTMLLDAAHVHAGTHLLDFPSSGPALAINAAHRRATVDVLTADREHSQDMKYVLDLAEVEGSVHVELLDTAIPEAAVWPMSYDVITSVEKLELMGPRMRKRYVQTLDRLLTAGGFLAAQSVVLTGLMPDVTTNALGVCKAYIWPALDLMTMENVHKLFDVSSDLRITAETHVGGHYQEGLRLKRATFEGLLREAAADGFDPVYRRLWVFQLAIREALFRVGALDAVQITATTRNRRRRR